MNQQDAYAKAKEALIAAVEKSGPDWYTAQEWATIYLALRIASGIPIAVSR